MAFRVVTAAALVGGALLTLNRVNGDRRGGDHGAHFDRAEFFKTSLVLWFVGMFLTAVYSALVYPFYVSPLRHLPTAPGSHWLFGHGFEIIGAPPGGPFQKWMKSVPNEGLIRYLWFFNDDRVFPTSREALAEVLVTNAYAFEKPESVTAVLGRSLGYGILLAEGDEHKRQRRNLNPAFAFRHIKNLYPLFWDKARELTAAMTVACKDGGGVRVIDGRSHAFFELEFGQWASRAALDIIGVAALGKDFGAIADENNELVRAYGVIFNPTQAARIMSLLGTVFPASFLQALPLQHSRNVSRATKWVRGVCGQLVQEKKARLADKDKDKDLDILSIALESGQFSDANLVDQLMTFLAAGHETTTRALTWAIYMLCVYPEVQERLRAEVRERLPSTSASPGGAGGGGTGGDDSEAGGAGGGGGGGGPPGSGVTSADIDRMPYLNAVCNEVLRCYSPVPVTARQASRDTTILGTPIRRGTRVLLVPSAINTDEAAWGERAGLFDPTRWLAEEGASAEERSRAASGGAASNYAFMTFLHGPRSCIGSGFARGEMACILAAVVGRFSFELVDEELMDEGKMEIKMEITARPARGMRVRASLIDEY